jgi:hypothetical protein
MKVALVLTGLMRCWEQAYPVFKTLFMDRYETDVYIHTWSEVGYYTGKGYLPEENGFVKTVPGERGFHASGQLIDATAIMAAYNPKKFVIEDYSLYEPKFEEEAKKYPNAYTRPKNTLAQAYKIQEGVQLLPPRMDYDLTVRARPDIVLEHDPGIFDPQFIYTLPSRNKAGRGTGDSIQIGSPHAINAFGWYQYVRIPYYYERDGISCPHLYTQSAIEDVMDYCDEDCFYTWQEMQCGAHVAHSPNGIYQEP